MSSCLISADLVTSTKYNNDKARITFTLARMMLPDSLCPSPILLSLEAHYFSQLDMCLKEHFQ